MRFGVNSIIVLVVGVITALVWIGGTYYHNLNNQELPPQIAQASSGSPLPNSFDKTTINQLYSSKDKFYDYTTPTPTPKAQ